MTPQIVERVDAWLACRSGSALSRRWSALASAWADQRRSALRCLVGTLADDAEATATAMRGVLLALVREDWNDPHIYVRKSVTRNQWVAWRKRLRDDEDEVKVSEGRTEDEALVAALEAAPKTGVWPAGGAA